MIFNVGVIAFSFLLLVYWFRYSCVLMLRTTPVRDYSKQVAAANDLKVFDVQSRLSSTPAQSMQELDELQTMLNRDYQLLIYLMGHAANFKTSRYELNQILLRVDYHLARHIYRVSKRLSLPRSAERLCEMAAIITHVANRMGERAALASAQ